MQLPLPFPVFIFVKRIFKTAKKMKDLSTAEENYLKAIFKISERYDKPAGTNAIAGELNTSAASVTDMLKRLAEKELIEYEPYKGVLLSESGTGAATQLIRRHRLWETFLVDKLGFTWDEVHDLAEQLEHIHSEKLVDKLDEFLGRPRFDPHGDPIPDAEGQFAQRRQIVLSQMAKGQQGVVVGVQQHSPEFLQHLERLDLVLGNTVELLDHFPFDNSLLIRIGDRQEQAVSHKIGQNVFVQLKQH